MCDKYTNLAWNIDNEGGCAYGKSVLSTQFCCEPEAAPKNSLLLLNKKLKEGK